MKQENLRGRLIERDRELGFVSVGREDYGLFGSDCSRYDGAALAAIRNVIFDKRLFCGCEAAVEINSEEFGIGTIAGKPLYILHALYRLHDV